jgi:LmbE family N-acetylglucosaminyl deacetylase
MTTGRSDSAPLRLMAILAHPDDESLGFGGALAAAAAGGAEVHLVTATRGERGRFLPDVPRPSDEEVGRVRVGELRAAATILGIREVSVLGYGDGALDQVPAGEVISALVAHIRRVRPQVILTFDPFGGYGHPDHVAISQLTLSAIVSAAAAEASAPGAANRPHRVDKLYQMAWTATTWAA